MYICVYMYFVYLWKLQVSNALELELWMIISHHVELETEPGLRKETQVLLTPELPLQPLLSSWKKLGIWLYQLVSDVTMDQSAVRGTDSGLYLSTLDAMHFKARAPSFLK